MNTEPKDTSTAGILRSVLRIGAGVCLITGNLFLAGFLLIFAECF
jgi:hypothetical protein